MIIVHLWQIFVKCRNSNTLWLWHQTVMDLVPRRLS